jgi:hypothetical protein
VALIQAGAGPFEGLGLDRDEATGANIVRVALEAPLKQIAINAGLEGGAVAEKHRRQARSGSADAGPNMRGKDFWSEWERPMTSFDDWGLPRSTGNLDADRSTALLAERTATTSAQRAAVAVRLADIRAREVRRETTRADRRPWLGLKRSRHRGWADCSSSGRVGTAPPVMYLADKPGEKRSPSAVIGGIVLFSRSEGNVIDTSQLHWSKIETAEIEALCHTLPVDSLATTRRHSVPQLHVAIGTPQTAVVSFGRDRER